VTAGEEKYFDLGGLSEYSSLGRTCLKELIRKGELKAYKPVGKLLVKKSEFDAWVSKYELKRFSEVEEMVNRIIKDWVK
jgi:excisionase family DNA binding protein